MYPTRALGILALFLVGCVGRIENGTPDGTPVSDVVDAVLADGACASGFTSCGGACVDLMNDDANCGGCATPCITGRHCSGGACVAACPAGQITCGGTCVNPQSNAANCGSCGHACAGGQVCNAGTCSTTCTLTMCGSACVDTATDAANCGTCGHGCGAGSNCVASACTTPCTMTMCGAACVNTATDPANCGSCGHACSSGQSCVAGTCTTPCLNTLCSGVCVNTANDPANCGSCGHACPTGQSCTASTCTTPPACPGAPAGVTANQSAALDTENQARVAMGIGCATMVTTINTGATMHCNYYSNDRGMGTCTSNPHVEVSGCPMFYAAQFYQRMTMAGYTGSPAFEDMAFSNNGSAAVQQWIDSVWHRTPVLSPWVRDIGYGSASGCDTMDFGAGASTPATVVATYPYANQINVPTSFDGRYEGPMPPAPPTGWPSGYPIHIYVRGSITTHELTVASTGTVVPHVWIGTSDAAAMGLLPNANVMYANSPLTSATRYHVHAVGSNSAGPVTLDWDFTTR